MDDLVKTVAAAIKKTYDDVDGYDKLSDYDAENMAKTAIETINSYKYTELKRDCDCPPSHHHSHCSDQNPIKSTHHSNNNMAEGSSVGRAVKARDTDQVTSGCRLPSLEGREFDSHPVATNSSQNRGVKE